MGINIVFEEVGEPNRLEFVEVEDDAGRSIAVGEWIKGKDGYWRLRIDHIARPRPIFLSNPNRRTKND